LERLHNSGRGHLVKEIENEVNSIEELIDELRAYPSADIAFKHCEQILQHLAQHELRLTQQLTTIEEQH
jgi:hypothetical protein